MPLDHFKTEEYFAQYEFTRPHMISASDCESIDIAELIRLGGGSTDEFLRVKLGYAEMAGSALLRREIASLYGTLDENQILVLGSPIEGIYLGLQALVEPGDHVVVLSPAYDALFDVAAHATESVSRWHLKNDETGWSLDFDRLDQLLTRPTKLLVINFPHNPTGFHPSKSELSRIVETARRHGVRIFSDEMYKGLEYDSAARLDSLADTVASSVVLGGASKSLGLPGLRLGWIATRDPAVYQKLLAMKCYTSMCSSQAVDYLGRMAVRAAPALIARNLRIVKDNLAIARSFFEKWRTHLQWIPPRAGSVCVFKINDGPAERFCHELANRFGVVLLPIRFMGYEDRFARIGLGRLGFEIGMRAFDHAMKEIH